MDLCSVTVFMGHLLLTLWFYKSHRPPRRPPALYSLRNDFIEFIIFECDVFQCFQVQIMSIVLCQPDV